MFRYGQGPKERYVFQTSTVSVADCQLNQFVSSISLPGHEDWIRSLVFRQPEKAGEALVLASGSQDANVRLWNIEPHAKKPAAATTATDPLSDELLDAFEASLGDLDDTEEGGRQISLKRHMLSVKTGTGRYVLNVLNARRVS